MNNETVLMLIVNRFIKHLGRVPTDAELARLIQDLKEKELEGS